MKSSKAPHGHTEFLPSAVKCFPLSNETLIILLNVATDNIAHLTSLAILTGNILPDFVKYSNLKALLKDILLYGRNMDVG